MLDSFDSTGVFTKLDGQAQATPTQVLKRQ